MRWTAKSVCVVFHVVLLILYINVLFCLYGLISFYLYTNVQPQCSSFKNPSLANPVVM